MYNRQSGWLVVLVLGISSLLGVDWMSQTIEAAPQAVITVNFSGDVLADDGFCSLREAITAANTDSPSGTLPGECAAGSGVDTIVVTTGKPSGFIFLSISGAFEGDNATGDLDITSSMTISSTPDIVLNVDQQIDRAFDIFLGATVTISGLTIQGGSTPANSIDGEPGGAIRNQGDLTLTESMLNANRTAPGRNIDIPASAAGNGGSGGATYSAGVGASLTIIDSIITSNIAGNGGDCEVFDCRSGAGGSGGGIYASGLLTIQNSIITNNQAGHSGVNLDEGSYGGGDGGGIAVEGATVFISATSVYSNAAGASNPSGLPIAIVGNAGDGGGIFAGGNALIKRSTISGNTTQSDETFALGGGI